MYRHSAQITISISNRGMDAQETPPQAWCGHPGDAPSQSPMQPMAGRHDMQTPHTARTHHTRHTLCTHHTHASHTYQAGTPHTRAQNSWWMVWQKVSEASSASSIHGCDFSTGDGRCDCLKTTRHQLTAHKLKPSCSPRVRSPHPPSVLSSERTNTQIPFCRTHLH